MAQRLYRKPLEQLEKLNIVRVVGLVDNQLAHAEKMHHFFPKAEVFNDVAHALQATDSELTLILSPIQHHGDQTILALRHGNHVLCEKPMASTEAKCAEMIAVAREMDRVLAVGMTRRFFPSFAQLKEWVAAGELGEVLSYSYQEGRIFDWDVTTPAGFTRQAGGGSGLFFDIGPHAVDLLIWLFGVPEVVSYADDALAGVEGNVRLELRSPVCSGSVQLSWDFPLRNELRVIGTRKEVVLRLDQFDKLAVRTGPSQFQEVPVDHRYPADTGVPARRTISPKLYTQSMFCQLIHLARAIRLGEPLAVGGETGKQCLHVIESARRRARPMEMPWLDPKQQAAYRALHWTRA